MEFTFVNGSDMRNLTEMRFRNLPIITEMAPRIGDGADLTFAASGCFLVRVCKFVWNSSQGATQVKCVLGNDFLAVTSEGEERRVEYMKFFRSCQKMLAVQGSGKTCSEQKRRARRLAG